MFCSGQQSQKISARKTPCGTESCDTVDFWRKPFFVHAAEKSNIWVFQLVLFWQTFSIALLAQRYGLSNLQMALKQPELKLWRPIVPHTNLPRSKPMRWESTKPQKTRWTNYIILSSQLNMQRSDEFPAAFVSENFSCEVERAVHRFSPFSLSNCSSLFCFFGCCTSWTLSAFAHFPQLSSFFRILQCKNPNFLWKS